MTFFDYVIITSFILFGVGTFFDDVIIMLYFGTFELGTEITKVDFINRKTLKMTKNR